MLSVLKLLLKKYDGGVRKSMNAPFILLAKWGNIGVISIYPAGIYEFFG